MSTTPLQIGPFVLGESIGEGGMGAVYRATHHRTGVDVALKVVKGDGGDEFRRQFHREVQAHAGLAHPGIVYLFDYGEISEEAAAGSDDLVATSPWVAMELADEGTVRDQMPLNSWPQIRDVLVQTLDALAYSHAREVVHRDLKPENLLVFDGENGPRIKLADFGIAHAFDDIEDSETDQLEAAAGTPLYMAPEQIRGRWRSYGPWTDLYALGCIAYQFVCGRPPFVADNPVTLTVHHCNEDRPRLDPQIAVPDGLEDWIHRMMAIEPDDRFWRAADAARALPVGDDLAAESPNRAEELEAMETVPADDGPTQMASTRLTPTKTIPPTEILTDLATTATVETTTEPSPASAASGGSGPEPTGEGSMGAVEAPSGSRSTLPDWRRRSTDELPTPMVGTGLGLFGLRESPFVDRDDERNSIWKALENVVVDNAFRLVMLSGESGTGKSRLARWSVLRADETGAATVLKTSHSRGGEARTEGLGGLVLRTVRGWRLDRNQLYEHLFEVLPALEGNKDFRDNDARALTEIVFPTEESGDEVDSPRFEFQTLRQKFAVVGRLLQRIGDHRPPLLWLDDLQWGSQALGLVEYLAGESDLPMLVIATLRSDVLAERPRLQEQVDQLKALDETDHHHLEPLSGSDHRTFIDRLVPLAPNLADRIAARTEGNPLFAQQLIGDLIDDDALVVSDRGFEMVETRELELPDGIYELWIRRIQRLLDDYYSERTDEMVQTLEIAAALGREIAPREWRAVCEEANLEVSNRLVGRLVARGMAQWTDDGWAFAHGMLAATLRRYARQAGRYQLHHRRCGRMFERLYPDRPNQTARRRANHWIEAEQFEEALDPLLVESRRLAELGDSWERRRVLERRERLLDKLGVGPNARARLENDVELAETRHLLGDIENRRGFFEQLLERCLNADAKDLAARCFQHLGNINSQLGSIRKAHQAFERGLDLAGQIDSTRVQTKLHLSAGHHSFFRHNLETAGYHTEQALELVDESNPGLQMRAELLHTWILVARGRYRQAQRRFDKLLKHSKQKGIRTISKVHTGLGDVARFQGDYDAALHHYNRAFDIAEATERQPAIVTALTNLALTTVAMGRFEQTRELLDRLGSHSTPDSDEKRYLVVLRCCIRLATAAGQRDWATFDEHFQMFADGWPSEFYVARDHPWLMELIAEFCTEADQPGRTSSLLELAGTLWERIGDDEAVERINRRLEALEFSNR